MGDKNTAERLWSFSTCDLDLQDGPEVYVQHVVTLGNICAKLF